MELDSAAPSSKPMNSRRSSPRLKVQTRRASCSEHHIDVRLGEKRTSRGAIVMSAFGDKADILKRIGRYGVGYGTGSINRPPVSYRIHVSRLSRIVSYPYRIFRISTSFIE